MKADVYSIEGKKLKEIELPEVFESEYDPSLIKRAVLASASARIQPKGNYPHAGMDNSAKYIGRRSMPTTKRGINVERARLPRKRGHRFVSSGWAARVPQAVGGRRAHPPKIEQITKEKINKKEKRKALKSAIAATAKKELVSKKHVFGDLKLPIVIENKFAELKKTADVRKALEAIKIYSDVENAKKKRKIRAGKGKARGRKYRKKKSILIVTEKNSPVYKAARNLEGVDICSVKDLSAEHLAPGAEAGRLTLWVEGAINALKR